jgi:hypothetical protein
MHHQGRHETVKEEDSKITAGAEERLPERFFRSVAQHQSEHERGEGIFQLLEGVAEL